MLTIDNATTALLIMDFQNDIAHPKGKLGAHGLGQQVVASRAVEHTALALAAAREMGLLVIHVGVAFRPGHPEIAGTGKFFAGIKTANALVKGTWGANFLPAVAPIDGEIVVFKRRMSAFAGTDLHLILREHGIRTLVLTGIATTFVMESTARNAVDQGYPIVVLRDCCASFTPDMHQASLKVLSMMAETGTAEAFAAALRSHRVSQ
jgi:nicotinamidase-related amidase